MKNALLLLIAICITTLVSAQQYVINAQITGFENGTKFYLNDSELDTDIDSAIIKNNVLSFKGTLRKTPQSLWVKTTVAKEFYYFTLLMGNEKINVKGDIKDFPFDLKITGSKTQDMHNKMIDLTKAGYKQRNKLVAEYFALTGDSAKLKAKAIWKVIGKIDSTDRITRMNFVRQNLNSFEALDALFYLKNDFPRDTIRKFYNSLHADFKNTLYAKRIDTYLKVGEIIDKGDSFYNFYAFDKDAKQHSLAELSGKYILLDFSTTFCGPCIESIPELKEISQKLNDNLSVVSFSCDAGKETWLKGLNRDQPQWLSLWDGKGFYGETIIKYGVSGYPTFVLINPQGKIVSKWSGYEKGALFKKVIGQISTKSN
ncbi:MULTISPECIES: TlpA disulfide reductase family protein [unclassified Pedobacter]|uniref:TlpA disulfide reductase family protein n=1 Tax=unclassified Pedobacter TaxID=2628915 RepID=UPI0014246D5B|nr:MULTISPECIES: TlpA disulfide reductase family protein [unclassified Pedobacter]NII84147.1 thiol-disulfide isomerase/thioredoxin [Pedobacter sp. SG908]NMN38937.1 thiol-disulfide isomerase/thioredoxin [Pedobacter sp. SG918]